jgi:hypothetical protein
MPCFRSQLLLADLDPFKGLPLTPNVIIEEKYSIFPSILDGNLPLTENPNLQPKEITPSLPSSSRGRAGVGGMLDYARGPEKNR